MKFPNQGVGLSEITLGRVFCRPDLFLDYYFKYLPYTVSGCKIGSHDSITLIFDENV